MATSNNLGLYLPVREDYISVKRDLSDNYELIDAAAGKLDIIINGNTASQNVTTGQYVTVLNSTITGITDGLYKSLVNVSAGNAFTSANLQAVTSGALNDLFSTLNTQIAIQTGTVTFNGGAGVSGEAIAIKMNSIAFINGYITGYPTGSRLTLIGVPWNSKYKTRALGATQKLNDTTNQSCSIYIDSDDSSVQFWIPSDASGKNIFFNFCYQVK